MEPTPGPELDRRVTRLLNGDVNRHHPYSTSDRAASRLARRLTHEFEITAEVELVESVWYCFLRRSGEIVASGSGHSRPLAVARAVANLHPSLFGVIPSAPGARHFPIPARSDRPLVPCRTCNRPTRRPSAGSDRVCHPCSYRSLSERRGLP